MMTSGVKPSTATGMISLQSKNLSVFMAESVGGTVIREPAPGGTRGALDHVVASAEVCAGDGDCASDEIGDVAGPCPDAQIRDVLPEDLNCVSCCFRAAVGLVGSGKIGVARGGDELADLGSRFATQVEFWPMNC